MYAQAIFISTNHGASLIALAHFYERYTPRIKILNRVFSFKGFYIKMDRATTHIIDASVPDIQVPTLVPKYTPMPNPWKRVFDNCFFHEVDPNRALHY